MKKDFFVHPSAIVDKKAKIGSGTKIWAFAQVRENAVIGKDCVIGNGVYIDSGVQIGDRVNIQNKALLYRNLIVENDVFIGPAACFTNDPFPRANVIRDLKKKYWRVQEGASIGANVCVLPELNIGRFAMVGAGSVVTKHVPDHAVVSGVPAKISGSVPKKLKK